MKREDKKPDLLELIDKGLKLTKKRLIESKKANGQYLAYQENGKIIQIKAEDY